ncbi:MAG: hypothetical protein K6F69_04000 [Treponema sp.]|nr:hypothetical protein [Treponema sp.]
MTDVENIEKLIKDIFNRKKTIKLKDNTNRCIAPLNRSPLNMFAYNFINRLRRLNEKFKDNPDAINDICEKIKNIGEATQSHWAGPYSELIALDFYTQFSDFIKISYINILPINEHKNSIPALNGQKEKIDIDICLNLRNTSIYTDVKSFNSVHIQIFDQIFENVELFALKKTGKNILIGVDNLSSIDYIDVKNNLGCEIKKIEEMLKNAILKSSRLLS